MCSQLHTQGGRMSNLVLILRHHKSHYRSYRNLAYSALAVMKIGMAGAVLICWERE